MSADPKGLEVREAHYPGRAPIDAYGGGGFRFARMSHRGSLLCVPSGIYAWEGRRGSTLEAADLQKVFEEADQIDVLLIGSGTDLVPVGAALRQRCSDAGMVLEVMSTGAAVRTFNVLLADQRRVSAALVAVD